jgi:multidrug efflux pump subunit AcrB
MVLLVGLVVKNAVLLLEEAERRVDRGEPVADAVSAAAHRRLRPISMTTAATVAGLFPLALGMGAGAELQRPLAIAVIGGLGASLFVTLALVPGIAAWILRGAEPADRADAPSP